MNRTITAALAMLAPLTLEAAQGFEPGGPVKPRGVPTFNPICFGTERVSVSSDGTEANGESWEDVVAISADGRFVAFTSVASNLVPNDSNNQADVFVHDRATGATVRVSVASNGDEAVGQSWQPRMSPNGRYVAFVSTASNLVGDDTNGTVDVFLHDRDLDGNGLFDELGGTITSRLSVSSGGEESNGASFVPRITPDGRICVFQSVATNLVPDDTNGKADVFVHDVQTGTTKRVTVSSTGLQSDGSSLQPDMSSDGRFVVFDSDATNLIDGDTNNARDVFVHDRDADENGVLDEPNGIDTLRISVDSNGQEGNAGSFFGIFSPDGSRIAFVSDASNLVPGDTNNVRDVFVHDRITQQTVRVNVSSNGEQSTSSTGVGSLAISDTGRYVTFRSGADNLVGDDFNGVDDIFRHDLISGQTLRVSLSDAGEEANGPSVFSWMTSDGSQVAFRSAASNLVPDDSNNVGDTFVRCVHPSDFDGNGDVDLADFAVFGQCFGGPGNPPAGTCPEGVNADLDGDGDVDLADFAIFAQHFTGS